MSCIKAALQTPSKVFDQHEVVLSFPGCASILKVRREMMFPMKSNSFYLLETVWMPSITKVLKEIRIMNEGEKI